MRAIEAVARNAGAAAVPDRAPSAGDTVQLKGGGPMMAVSRTITKPGINTAVEPFSTEPSALCHWLDNDNRPVAHWWPFAVLEVVGGDAF